MDGYATNGAKDSTSADRTHSVLRDALDQDSRDATPSCVAPRWRWYITSRIPA
jgi:hypothetical protein